MIDIAAAATSAADTAVAAVAAAANGDAAAAFLFMRISKHGLDIQIVLFCAGGVAHCWVG